MEKDSEKIKKTASQGRQTLFRVVYRTQINLIRIADNKANMILGINAMIISILIVIISSRVVLSGASLNGNPKLIIPVVLIMLTALFAALFAILAAQPRLLTLKEAEPEFSKKTSKLFFENIHKLSTDDYINQMESLINSPKEIYENMIIDIHNQARILHRKYSLLRFAYSIFLIGYIVSILSFLILWLMTFQ